MIRPVNLGKAKAQATPESKAVAEEKADRRLERKFAELQQTELQKKALDLYVGGKTPKAIAKELELSVSETRRMLETAITEEREEVRGKLRDLTELRFSAIIDSFFKKMQDGDPKAAGVILDVIERQCRMNGLNSPVEIKLQEGVMHVLRIVKNVVPATDYAKISAELARINRAGGAEIGRAGGEALPPLGEFH